MTTTSKAELEAQLKQAEEELQKARAKARELRRRLAGESVVNYTLRDRDNNPVPLTDLFGDKDDLITVHNMGKHCRWCTLWADGFNGVHQHLNNWAAFVVISNDPPETMREFADSRDWKFTILSGADSPFAKEMGYMSDDDKPWPGISTFHRESDGTIRRVAHTWFGPGDDFCAVWHIFDMLEDGPNKWEPQYSYA